MGHEITEIDEGEGCWTAIKKKDLEKMDEQLDLLWAMRDLKGREKMGVSNQQEWELKGREKVGVSNQQEWEINLNEIIFKELLDKDTCAEVYKGVYNSEDVIVTVFERREKVQQLPSSEENNLPTCRSPFREKVSLWYKIDHPNILRLIGAKIDEPEFTLRADNEEVRLLSNMSYLVVEYRCGDTLRSFLSKNREKKLAFKIVIELALHLARGLAYLHSRQLIHGNVKPENLLLDRNFKLTITEFETSNMAISNHQELACDRQTISYMAPEVIDFKPYDRKCDIYSFGICLWEIYCCDMPYPDLSFSELSLAIFDQNLRPEIPKGCPKALANVMQQCWDTDAGKRPEMEQVVLMLEALDTPKGKKIKFLDAQSCFCFRK